MPNFFPSWFRGKNKSKRAYALPLRLEALEDRFLLTAVRPLTGFTSNFLAPTNDGSTGSVSLGFSVDFGGTSYNQVYVNNNGNVTFTNSESTATPHSMASNTLPIIAPFFADVDTRLGNVVSYGNDTVNGNSAFGVDWVNVGYYNQHTSSLNSFQLILINRPDLGSGAFEVEFNYDHIGWETGDGSGGTGGLGGTSAYAGYSSATSTQSTVYQLLGSGSPGSFLDSNTALGLVNHDYNSGGVVGRYDYTILPAVPVVVTNPGNQSNTEGDAVSLHVNATDTTAFTYSATGLPSGLSLNPTTGYITGTIRPGASALAPYVTNVTVTDGSHSANQTFNWSVADPITITNPGTKSNSENDTVSLSISASDSRGGTLDYYASGLPQGLSINLSSGVISGTVGAGGAYTPTVMATDGIYAAKQSFNWTVSSPITITTPGNQSNVEGNTVSLSIGATDSTSATLTYAATMLPPGLSINTSTGHISGTVAPGDAASGPYPTTITVSDGTYSEIANFTWTVSSPITITNPGTQTNTESDSVSLTLSATDSTSATLTYTANGLPPGLTINTATGVISGTVAPGSWAYGSYPLSVTVSDNTYAAVQQFTWIVNDPVVITAPAKQTSLEGAAVSLAISATDSTSATLAYSAQGLPPGLHINTSTGVISGTVGLGASASSSYLATVVANDGTHSNSQTFSWTITDPVTIVNPGDQTNRGSDVVSLAISASDSTSATLTYTAQGLPPGLSINAGSGVISGTIGPNLSADGAYVATIIANDDTFSATLTFNWTVNGPVTITTINDQTTPEGTSFSLPISASDSTSATLTYSAAGLPTGLSINGSTGLISGTLSAGGTFYPTVTVTDGTYSADQTFAWNVPAAGPLQVTNPGDEVNSVSDSVSLQIQAHDSSTATLTYSATSLPNGLTINSSSGLISGTISSAAFTAGPFGTTVSATDGTHTDYEAFSWCITQPVAANNPGNLTNNIGDGVVLPISAVDLNSGTLTYSATGLPTGLSIDSSTGLISGTIGSGASTSTPYSASITASDGTNSDTVSLTWTIHPATPITITNPGGLSDDEGDTVSLTITAVDSTSATLTYSAQGLPDGLSINSTNGHVSGTVSSGAAGHGPFAVSVTAADGTYSDTQMFLWSISNAVTLSNPTNQSNTEGDSVSITLSASDSTAGTLRYSAQGLPFGLRINHATGVISGSLSAGDAASSPYSVTVTASDGTYSESQTFTWTIADPITVSSVSNQVKTEGNTISLSISASDTASGTLSYAALGLPAGLHINPTTGVISGTIVTGNAALGSFSTVVIVSDGTYSGSQAFTWTVGSPITITNPGNQSNNASDTVSLSISAMDSTSATLTYSAQGLPPGLHINASTGVISR